MKKIVAKLISKEINLELNEVANLIEIPPKQELGDFAFPCFILSKRLKKSPLQIAEDLTQKLRKKLPKEISNISMNAGYVNFFMDKKILAEKVLTESLKENFGKNNEGKKKKILIDMSSPNIAKPFGIGHLRSTIIGNSIAKISKYNGFEVVKINHPGDWGTQFGKIILAYKKWGDDKKLKDDAIGHLQELYVRINTDDSLDDLSRAEFKKLEEGDKENLKIWKEFWKLSMKKFEEIYKILGIDFDFIEGESKYNDKMNFVVEELRKRGLLRKDDGALIVDLKKEHLGAVLIQKSDGTSLYATRDIAAAINRKKEYHFDKLIYEVGQEQKLHFKQVFKVLELMNYSWAKDCIHVSHGLYLGPEGKKFSTRKGKTIYMKDILEEVVEKAKLNLRQRENLTNKEIEKRALKIAIAAIFYGDLKNNRENNIIFDSDKFLSFEGDTGPYLLYSYARASSITKRIKSRNQMKIIDLKETEIKLIKKINDFPDIIKKAYKNLAPNLIANYSFELAQNFNEFYHDCPVLGSIEESFRLRLTIAFKKTLKKSLDLLGIDVLEEM